MVLIIFSCLSLKKKKRTLYLSSYYYQQAEKNNELELDSVRKIESFFLQSSLNF